MPVRDAAGGVLLAHDEHMRGNTTLESLGALKPAFAAMGAAQFDAVALERYPDVTYIEHVHTAGNSSGIVDAVSYTHLTLPTSDLV